MQQLIQMMKENMKNNFDSVCAITGPEGVGKSTLAWDLSSGISPTCNVYDNIIYRPKKENIADKIFNLPKFSPIIIDEAMRAMYKLDWMTKKSRELSKIFSICRKQNKAVFLNIPYFFDLNPYYRNNRVRIWIYVPERGLAMVFMKDLSPFTTDPWHKDENQKLIDFYTKRKKGDLNALKSALRSSRNYIYEFKFPDMDERIKILYTREAEKYSDEDDQEEDKYKMMVMRIFKKLKEDGKLSYHGLELLTGVNDATIQRLFEGEDIFLIPNSRPTSNKKFNYSDNDPKLLPNGSDNNDIIEPEKKESQIR